MTVMTWVMDGLLAAMAAAMLIKGKYGITRQLAAAPLVLAVLDAAFAGQIQPMLTPVLSWLLLGLELTVLLGCGRLLQVDRARARSTARRRQLQRSRTAFEQAMGERDRRRCETAGRSSACA